MLHTAPIPLDWTPDQALAVVTFLEEVLDAIHHVHGDAIDQLRTARHEAQYELALTQATRPAPPP